MKIPYPSKNAWIVGAIVTVGVLVAIHFAEGVGFTSRAARWLKLNMGLPVA